jgi:AraC-like DNA-binding protein
MGSSKATPGPWRVNYDPDDGTIRRVVTRAAIRGDIICEIPSKGCDARLIAEAHAMEALLRQMVDEDFNCTPRQYFIAAQERARAILARIDGGEK